MGYLMIFLFFALVFSCMFMGRRRLTAVLLVLFALNASVGVFTADTKWFLSAAMPLLMLFLLKYDGGKGC